MKTRNTKLIISLILVFSMGIFIVPDVQAQARPTIKIGALGPLAITPGEDMKKGVELAVDEINANGGVTVDSTVYDLELFVETTSGSDGLPNGGVADSSMDTLINTHQVVATIGGFRTEVVVGNIMPKTHGAGMPFLGVGSTAPIWTPYYWRVGPTNGSQLALGVVNLYLTHLLPNHEVSNVVVVREDATWTVALGGGIKYYLEALSSGAISVDMTTMAPINQAASGSDISSALDAIASNNDIDAVLHLFSAPVGKTFVEQWAAKGLNSRTLLAGINVDAQRSDYFTNTQGAAEGEILYEAAPGDVNPTAKTAAFRTAFNTAYGINPTYTSFAAYDSVYVIKEALERAGDVSRAAIQNALIDTDYVGTAYKIKFTNEPVEGQVRSLPPPLNASAGYNVHDLYTPATIGVKGDPYAQVFFTQWQADGSKKTVFAGTAEGMADINLPPYAAEDPIPSSDAKTPFNILMVLVSFISFATISGLRKKKKFN
ncbi:MAG: ABC transporter substrate-binding protein [Candidatus Heimdallarchaeota archaeon]|nr:ABC transporter substrate-binding protein [Candidatus Heimdallarchaeota archaeon]